MIKMTTDEATNYAQGDWVVHCHYGVGQIEAIERKKIGDHQNTYFRIKTADILIWTPVGQMDDKQFRSIVPKERFKEALRVLNKPPKEMSSNLNARKTRIKRVTSNNAPKETARLIRDLRARRREKKGLNQSERQALQDLTKRFLQEWSVCVGLTMGQARRRLNKQLRRGQVAAQSLLEDGQKNKGKPDSSSTLLEALVKRDDEWSKWLNQQLVKEM